jgi:RNA polymerase sigma factor (sigma-70 family)
LQQLAQDDRRAFEIIYNKYWQSLLDQAWKNLRDKQAAEDLVQGVFLSLWQNRKHLDIHHLEAYFKTAIRYKVLNQILRSKRTLEFFASFYEIFQEKNTPETMFVSKNLLEVVHAYAAALPVKRREIFMLYVQRRLSTKEIAVTLNLSQKTVQNQLCIAMQGLRTKMAPVLICLINTHF